MKHTRLTLLLIAIVTSSTSLMSQAPVCDGPICTPNTGSPSYSGAADARTAVRNGRGSSTPFVTTTRLPLQLPKTETVVGSQSYSYVVPILNLPGRGGLDLNLNLYYNSRIWDVDTSGGTVTFNADRDFPSYGFRLDFGYLEFSSSLILTKGDGTKIGLASPEGLGYAQSVDGSNIVFGISGLNILTYANGTQVQYQAFPSNANLMRPVSIKDANGNYITIAYVSGHDQMISTVTDTLGRVITFNYNGSNQLTSLTQALHPSGTKTLATFAWGNPYSSGQTWYSFSGLTVNGAPTVSQFSVLTGCTYPNGTGYKFNYGDWGIVNKIDRLSSTVGAQPRSYISYNYPTASQGALTDAPAYTQQTISPDGTSNNNSVWTYATTKNGTGIVTSMTVTDPLGNISVTSLDPGTGLLSSVQMKDSSGTVLRTTSYSWTGTFIGSTVPGTITTTLNDTGQQSAIQYGYDYFDNVSDVYEYDFGLQLKRHTVTTYLNSTNTGSPHIMTLPTQILVKDGNGNTVARTDMSYDTASLTLITGAASHDDAGFGTGHTVRGNLTSVTRYSNAAGGSGQFIRNFTYDTLGNLRTAQLDCCNNKTINFISSTQYAYPDSVVRGPSGLQFTSSFAYDFDTGLLLASTDENGQVTHYQYDSMNRTTAVSLPPQNGTVVQLNTDFGDSAASPTVTNYSTNSGNSGVTLTTFDGLGHTMQVDNKDGSTVISSAKSVYDKLWRRTQASNPYAPGETPVYTTFAYDGLSRLTRVTPPSAGYTQYDYLGNKVTITDPAGKQRKSYTDALGRLIEVDEPGWGDALKSSGTVTIIGGEQKICTFFFNNSCHHFVYDIGNISITVNGATKSTTYNSGSTTSSVALALATAINADTTYPVTAALSGSTITLTSVQPGANTNYSLSGSSSTSDPTDFTGPSFAPSFPLPTLTGGIEGTPEGYPTFARPIVTTYGYDLLDRLTSASVAAMGPVNGVTYTGQPRSYVYDSMGRLTSATTPESGTITNYYTDVNNQPCSGDPSLVCRVQDARSVTKTFGYDPINRPVTVTYSDGTPLVTYAYANGVDRLASITEGPTTPTPVNSQTFAYDNFGRITSVSQSIDQVPYLTQYTYNLLGQLATITYPSTRVVTQSFDATGRMASIASGGTSYLSGLTYNAAGETLGLTLGNGVQGAFTYNDHLQLASLRYFKSGVTPDPLNLGYDYTSATQPNNNGQIQAVHYYTQPGTEDTNKSESFTYDTWFRLKAAQTANVNANTAGTWSLAWTYDRLGNRLSQSLAGGNVSVGTSSFAIDPATNRINGLSYDNAGNMISDGSFTYAYDGANRMKQAQQVASPNTVTSSTYFGAMRIKKVVGSTTTRYIYSGTKLIAEYVGTNPTLSKEYIYAGSQLLATIAGTSTTYHHPDHLSNRAETDATGAVVRTSGNFPYGETWYESAADQLKFTTYTRDSGAGETGLDYAMFRHYNSGQGRFMSADLLAGHPRVPQSLNRYAYARDPVNNIDPLGLFDEPFETCNLVAGEGYVDNWCETHATDTHDEVEYTNLGGGPSNRPPACNGVTSGDLLYDTPSKHKRRDGTHDTGGEHIYKYHIDGDPIDKSQYLNDIPPVPKGAILPFVVMRNASTFEFGTFSQDPKNPNSNITVTYQFPEFPYDIPGPNGITITVKGLGRMAQKMGGGITPWNTLILGPDCRFVVTSFAGLPGTGGE